MKYIAKHPGCAAYDLTREEMVSPRLIQQLSISDEWVVRVGEQWLPIQDFLGGKVPVEAVSAPTAVMNPHAADAAWTPITVFCLIMRIIGVVMLGIFAWGCWSGVSLLAFSDVSLKLIPSSVVMPVLSEFFFLLAAGIYLAGGAPGLARWIFRKRW